ncbi:TonB-dependent receptor [Porphyromonas sp.]|uniref:TonB-dependent receptor n=1 Tax=Porphyromonas sp. TaxID=1924944 RepID=UPI0026DDB664|nr:TonB-dependent receptor [Porphyromonas sp.]MDO4695761.1 TonB-dependent receptor [Porphyromonas sp.]MDO4770468.1 TonB-dependent receptor [Porphyromonas sp.]
MNIKQGLLLLSISVGILAHIDATAQEVKTSDSETLKREVSQLTQEELELEFDPGMNMELPALLNASRDPFGAAVAYNLSPFRYRLRGLDGMYTNTLINGIKMNDMNTGFTAWSLWGGLNDITRNQETVLGLSASAFDSGNLGGTQALDFRASAFSKGVKLTYSNSNRTYLHRAMITASTGLRTDGWAATISVGTRLGNSGYTLGTFYDAQAIFLGIEKRLDQGHALALSAFVAPTRRGVAMGSTQEAYDLVGSNHYNPNVGYQNGKVRNARVRQSFEPVVLLTHDWKISRWNKLSTSVMLRAGHNAYSGMNWIGQDPRPDYYRNLPSNYEGIKTVQDALTELWESGDRSTLYIDFDRMYRSNLNNQQIILDDKGNVVADGKRAMYIIEDRRNDQRQLSLASTLNSKLSEMFSLDAGVRFAANKTSGFTTVKDLLGGDYWYDIDKFAERDFSQDPLKAMSDLNNPYRVVKEGDKFGYDYDTHIIRPEVWGVLRQETYRFDNYLALQLGHATMYRDGKMKRGLFPDNSYGKSDVLKFFEYDAKLGSTFKISGQHYVSANISVGQRAPLMRDIFVSSRSRNTIVEGLKAERSLAGDLSYVYRSPFVKARLSGFFTRIDNKSKTISFYDDEKRTFGQYVMTGIGEQYVGIEAGAEIKLSPTWTLNAAGSIGDFFYHQNANYSHYVDNTEKLLGSGTVYWKDYKISGTPQKVASLGVNYRSPKYWYAGLTVNYAADSYISMNPTLRTTELYEADGFKPEFAHQENFGSYWILDANIGKSWRFARKYTLAVNLSASNVLNNKAIKTGGFEQMRNRFTTDDSGKRVFERPFDKKYFYMFGMNYFANISFRW